MKKYVKFGLLISLVLAADLYLLQHFNTTIWPYLWPKPGIFIVIGFICIALWFREIFSALWLLRIVGAATIFIGQSYLLHSFQITITHFSAIALLHLIGVTGVFFVMVVNYINQFSPKRNKQSPPLPAELPFIAAVVPTYGEPYEILEKTILSLKQLDYPAERLCILISDDGHREEVRSLARLHNVDYNLGSKKDAKAGNLNAACQYLADHYPQASLILTQDADELIHPAFLKKTVGYFEDESVAFVQTPKEALTPKGDPFGNRDRVFYDILQPGRNGSGAAFSCGSGAIWRLSAIRSIGGFATWNIVEDLTTSYYLHSAGYKSEYHNQVLTVGLSPDDIPGMLKQRGTWAADTWRLFLFDNPLRKQGLSIRQRLQYLELGLFYVASVFLIPLLMFTPALSLALDQYLPIEGSALIPWLIISFLYYITLARGRVLFILRMWQYWIGHWPTYTRALWVALRSRNKKPTYKVTRKTRENGFYGHLLWPQFLYIFAGFGLIAKTVYNFDRVDPSAQITNVCILLYFMFMVSGICRAAFYGMNAQRNPFSSIFSRRPAQKTNLSLARD